MHPKASKKAKFCMWEGDSSEQSNNSVMARDARFKERFLKFQERGEQLLPGIPNEITLNLITVKLSWRTVHSLSSVSRCWQDAIRSNEVYDARVRANSTETMIVHYHVSSDRQVVALHSTREKCCYELPPIPWLLAHTLQTCQAIALQSKVYVLGGSLSRMPGEEPRPEAFTNPSIVELGRASPEVYVLDLSGQRTWEQCASMLQARSRFGCGVVDEKIYVFGGETVSTNNVLESLLEAEVYDPQENKWSSITQMPRRRFGYQVATLGKELLLYKGMWLEMDRSPRGMWQSGGTNEDVYNPAKNEWRSLELFWDMLHSSNVFVAKEKLYRCSQARIDVCDFDQKRWLNRHANSFSIDGRMEHYFEFGPTEILAVNDQLVVTGVLCRWTQPGGWHVGTHRQSFHCKGFDTEKKELVWQELNCPEIKNSTVVSIQL